MSTSDVGKFHVLQLNHWQKHKNVKHGAESEYILQKKKVQALLVSGRMYQKLIRRHPVEGEGDDMPSDRRIHSSNRQK